MAKGKVLVLRYQGKILTVLMGDNRLLYVSACDERQQSLVGNIYVGKVQNIVSNIQAAFVEIHKGLLCYLSLSDVKNPVLTGKRAWDGKLKVGEELLVQVERDALKTKQPAVTTRLSLSGTYMVLQNDRNTGKAGESRGDVGECAGKIGISNKLSAKQKEEIRNFIEENGLSTKYDVVIRTNAGSLDGDYEALAREWQHLNGEMDKLLEISTYRTCYSCLKSGIPEYLKAFQELYQEEYDEIITDDAEIHETVKGFLETTGNKIALRFYKDELLPLYKLYSLESRLQEAVGSRVWLKSGGYLVIEQTEALTSIDVNTGKYDAKKGIPEETYHKINMEAAKEIALQLRLRNLSGIIIVDFINVKSKEKEKQLLQELQSHVRKDSVKTDVIDMTALGLVEITRKKVNKPLWEQLKQG